MKEWPFVGNILVVCFYSCFNTELWLHSSNLSFAFHCKFMWELLNVAATHSMETNQPPQLYPQLRSSIRLTHRYFFWRSNSCLFSIIRELLRRNTSEMTKKDSCSNLALHKALIGFVYHVKYTKILMYMLLCALHIICAYVYIIMYLTQCK